MANTIKMTIVETSCRGCELCVDICPTQVVEYNAGTKKAVVARVQDCIGCLSCLFTCPSGAINHDDIHMVPNYYRDIDFSRRMEKFL